MSIADYVGKRGGNGAVKIEPMQPPVPLAKAVETYAPPEIRQSRYSEEAAKAAQYVADLEQKIAMLESRINVQQSHIQVLEESNTILHEENRSLAEHSDRLTYVSTVIETRLHMATEVLLGIKAVVPPRDEAPPAPIPDEALKTVVDAVEKELAAAVEAKPQEAA